MDHLPHSSNVKTGSSVRIRKVIYTGHASTIYSVDNAVSILDQVGQRTRSEDVLPFALRLVVGDDLIEIAEDNNEFSCGNALSKCLEKFEGLNVMVCVSRHVEGCFVSDMIQHLKIRAVREAAQNALDLLYNELKGATFNVSESKLASQFAVNLKNTVQQHRDHRQDVAEKKTLHSSLVSDAAQSESLATKNCSRSKLSTFSIR